MHYRALGVQITLFSYHLIKAELRKTSKLLAVSLRHVSLLTLIYSYTHKQQKTASL